MKKNFFSRGKISVILIFICFLLNSCSYFFDNIKSEIEKKEQICSERFENNVLSADKLYKDSIAIADKDRAFFNIRWGISGAEFLIERDKFRNEVLDFNNVTKEYKLLGITINPNLTCKVWRKFGLYEVMVRSEDFYVGTGEVNMSIPFKKDLRTDTSYVYFQMREMLEQKYGLFSYNSNHNLCWRVGDKEIVLEWYSFYRQVERSNYLDPYKRIRIPIYGNDYYRQARIRIVNNRIKQIKNEMIRAESENAEKIKNEKIKEKLIEL